MIDNILYSLNAVVPLILLMSLGFILKYKKVFSEDFFNGIDKIVFYLALPVYIFNEVSNAEIDEVFDVKLAVYGICGITISFILLMIIAPLVMRKNHSYSTGALIQGIYRANFALLGVPLAGNLFGSAGSASAAMAMVFAVPLFNIFGVVALAVHSPDEYGEQNQTQPKTKKVSFKKIFINVLKNPLIIGVMLGIPFMFFDIIPVMIQRSINYISGMSTPLALIGLGAGFNMANFLRFKENTNENKGKIKIPISLTAAFLRVIVMPLIFVTAAVLLGFRDAGLIVIFVLFGTPTAVGSYILAKNMNGDYELAGEIVVLTTLMCPATIFIGSFILRTLGLI